MLHKFSYSRRWPSIASPPFLCYTYDIFSISLYEEE